MKKITAPALLLILCFAVVSLIAFFNAEHSEPSWVMWSQTYGGAENDYANSVVQTSDGGYAIAGYTKSFGAGNHDFWLVKTDAQGIPEFPSWIILPFLIMFTVVVIVFKKKVFRKIHD